MTITMTAWRRPGYTMRVLDSLVEAEKPEDIGLVASIDPGCRDVAELFENLPFETHIIVNGNRLGLDANTLQALEKGFEFSDEVLHIEDDTVLAPDCLYYIQWALKQYRDDPDIFTVTSFHRSRRKENPRHVKRNQWFSCWGWATWKDRFEDIREHWHDKPAGPGQVGWDWNTNMHARKDRYEIYPLLSRCENIGKEGGDHLMPPGWFEQHVALPWWAKTAKAFCLSFEEVAND